MRRWPPPGSGTWSLSHNQTADIADTTQLALRAMAPTQLAAAVMLAAGGVVALAASPQTALVVLIVCVAGALGTLATGSWQSARFALRQEARRPAALGAAPSALSPATRPCFPHKPSC